MIIQKLAVAALTIALGASMAFAQTATSPATPVAPKAPAVATTPAPTAPVAGAPVAAAKKGAQKQAMTAEGKACSADADAKNLHGKERKKFRAACMKEKTAAPKKS